MSAIYHTEPPTQGKVLLRTTFGDIDIELWSKEAPLACRNFIQLALEGYYDNTPVNRVIKGFMVQMGDPTGLGTGGDSIWSRPFKDEFHGRIRFNHRGQVAMANENAPNTNRSQFFITLDPCEWLNRKHTIFGKVTGVTMFNVVKMGDVEVDSASDKPLDPMHILRIEVLSNPFDDIIPRVSALQISSAKTESDSKTRSTRKAVKNKKLLSFGDGSDEEEAVFTGKIKSSHDSKFKSNFMSSKVAAEITETLKTAHRDREVAGSSDFSSSFVERQSGIKSQNPDTVGDNFDNRMKTQLLKRVGDRKEQKITLSQISGLEDDPKSSSGVFVETDVEKLNALASSAKNDKALAEKSAELKRLREGLLQSRRAVNVAPGSLAEQLSSADMDVNTGLLSPLEQRRQKYLKRKRVHGSRDEETLNKLQAFTTSLRASKKNDQDLLVQKKLEADHYHGQVLEGSDGEVDRDEDLQGWHSGKLKFKKHVDDSFRNGADGRSIDDYSHVDMRHADVNRPSHNSSLDH